MSRALITRSAFSELAGITKGAVTQLCAPGKALSGCLVGKKIDRLHPDCIAYLEAKAKRPGKRKPKITPLPPPDPDPPPPPPQSPQTPLEMVPEHIREMADKTLRELVDIFGTDEQFFEWLKSIEKMEVIHDRRIKNEVAAGELVSRKLVADYLIDPINTMHERLMSDGARTMAAELYAMAGAGRTQKEFEAYLVEYVGSFVRALKPKLKRAIRDV
jgi:hypothetical protein